MTQGLGVRSFPKPVNNKTLRKVDPSARNLGLGGVNDSPLREGRRLALLHSDQLQTLFGEKTLGPAVEPPALRSSILSDLKAFRTPGQLPVGGKTSWAHLRMESLGEHQGPEGPPKKKPRCPIFPLSLRAISAFHRYDLISTSHSQLCITGVIISTLQVRKSSQRDRKSVV